MRWLILVLLLGVALWYIRYHGTPSLSWHTRHDEAFLAAVQEFMALRQDEEHVKTVWKGFLDTIIPP